MEPVPEPELKLVPVLLHLRVKSRPENDHLAAPLQRGPDGVLHQVHSLLLGEPADDAQHGDVIVPQSHALPQGPLCRTLALHSVGGGVGQGEVGVVQRVPDGWVDAVEDSPKKKIVGSAVDWWAN